MRQIRVGSSKLELMPPGVREGMTEYLADLARRVKIAVSQMEHNRIALSYDYIIEACVAKDPKSVFDGDK